jgi:hypothetical protein
VSAYALNADSDIDELIPNLHAYIHLRNVCQIDKHEKIPLEVCDILIHVARADAEDTVYEEEPI